jgi:hypothetical protein
MSDRLKALFEGLPKYQEEVLFNAWQAELYPVQLDRYN